MQIVPGMPGCPAESRESATLWARRENRWPWGASGFRLVPLPWRGQQRRLLSHPSEWEAAEHGFLVHQELQAQAVTWPEQGQGLL